MNLDEHPMWGEYMDKPDKKADLKKLQLEMILQFAANAKAVTLTDSLDYDFIFVYCKN